MAKKTLRLQLEVGISGDKVLNAVNKAIKDYDVSVTKLTHSMEKNGRVVKKQTVDLAIQGKTLKEVESARKSLTRAMGVNPSGKQSTVVTNVIADNKAIKAEKVKLWRELGRLQTQALAENKARTKAHLARITQLNKKAHAATFAGRLNSVPRTVTPQRRNIIHGMSQAGRENTKRILADQVRLQEVANVKRQQAVALANKEAKAQQRIAAASKKSNKSLHKSVLGHKSLIRHVFDVVAGYRLINFAINKVQQAILAIPKAGIAQQANIASLTGVFGSATGAKELAFVADIADKYGLALESLETSFVQFAPSAKLAGASLEEVNQIFDDFSAVGTVLHKTPDQMQAIFLALEQMFAKGVVQSEEIKKQLGNQLPAAVEIAAEAVGKTPAVFMEAMRKNQIIASEAVPKIAALYRKIFAPDKVLKSISGQLLANYQRIITAATLINREFFAKSESLLNDAAKGIVSILKTLKENLDGVVQVAKLVASLFLTRVVSSLIAVTIKTLIATTANIRFAWSFRGIRGAVGAAAQGMGGFVKNLTGIPPQIILVVASMALIGAAFLRMAGASLRYGNNNSVALAKQEELTKAVADTATEQAKSSDDTLQTIRDQRDTAAKLAKEALDDFEAIAQKSNGFYISIGKSNVSLANFVSASWEVVTDKLTSGITTVSSTYDNELDFLKNIIINLGKEVVGAIDIVKKSIDGVMSIFVGSIAVIENIKNKSEESLLSSFSKAQRHYIDNTVTVSASFASLLLEIEKKVAQREKEQLDKKLKDQELKRQEAWKKKQQNAILAAIQEGDAVNKIKLDKEKDFQDKLAKLKKQQRELQVGGRAMGAAFEQEREFQTFEDFFGGQGEEGKEALKILAAIRKQLKVREKINVALAQSQSTQSNYLLLQRKIKIDLLNENITRKDGLTQQHDLYNSLRKAQQVELKIATEHSKILQRKADLNKENAELQIDAIMGLERKLDIELKILETKQKSNTFFRKDAEEGLANATSVIDPSGAIDKLSPTNLTTNKDAIALQSATRLSDLSIAYDKELIALQNHQEKALQATIDYNAKVKEIEAQTTRASINNFGQYALGVADVLAQAALARTQAAIASGGAESKEAKRAFAEYKAIMIAKTIMATALAVMNIWATNNTYAAIALTVVAIALGAVQIAKISQQKMPSAHGGLDFVPREQTYLLDRGERVLSPRQNTDFTQFIQNNNTASPQAQSNVKIVNIPSDDFVESYLESEQGERIVMNIFSRNGA